MSTNGGNGSRIDRIHLFGSEIARMFSDIDDVFSDREIIKIETEDEFVDALPDIECLLGFRIPRDHWARAKNLRLLQIPGAGVDSVLPADGLPATTQICNASGCHEPEMPEFVIAAINALVYRIPTFVERQQAKTWKIARPAGPIEGRTLCVVGLGTIGQSVARRAAALGMRVVGVRNSGEPVEGVDVVVTPDRRLEVLSGAGAVVVLTPLTDSTRCLISGPELSVLAPGAVLVDVSRGGVVDTDALLEALRSGPLESALVDVFETEPLPEDSLLWTTPNLTVTPHTAGWSRDYSNRILDLMMKNMQAIESGERPPSLVDQTKGY